MFSDCVSDASHLTVEPPLHAQGWQRANRVLDAGLNGTPSQDESKPKALISLLVLFGFRHSGRQ